MANIDLFESAVQLPERASGTLSNADTDAKRVFIDTADGLLKMKDSAGNVTTVGAPGALDNLSNVSAASPVDGDGLLFNGTAGEWQAGPLASGATINMLINGGMAIWQRGTGSTSSAAGSRTWLADRWYVQPSGAAITQQRSTSVPTNNRSRYSLQLNGAASATIVQIGQRLEAIDTPRYQVTFSAQVYNNSGAAFAPVLIVTTPTAADDWTTSNSAALTQTLQSCPDGTWTEVSHTFDTSGYTDIANGVEIALQIPSGSLVAGDSVRVTQVQLVAGSTASDFQPRPVGGELALCQRYYQEFNPGNANYVGYMWAGLGFIYNQVIALPVPMRVAATVTDTAPTWTTSYPSTNNRASFYDPFAGTYVGSLGTFDITYTASPTSLSFRYDDSVDFSGSTAGNVGRTTFGEAYRAYLDAEL